MFTQVRRWYANTIGRDLQPLAECEAADQGNQEKHDKDEKQNLGNSRRRNGYAGEAKDCGYDSDHQEDGRLPKHETSIQTCIN